MHRLLILLFVSTAAAQDLVLINGAPDKNISDIRKVVSVVTNGRMYDSRKLAQSVGFTR